MKSTKYTEQKKSYINYPPMINISPSESYDNWAYNVLRDPLEDEDIDPQYARNYNYLERLFQKSCAQLQKFEKSSLIEKIGEFKFNSQFIDKIENVIDELSENDINENDLADLHSFKDKFKEGHDKYIQDLNTAVETSNLFIFKSIIYSAPFIADIKEELQQLAIKAIKNIKDEKIVDFLQIICTSNDLI